MQVMHRKIGRHVSKHGIRKSAWLFPGQGSQYQGMGKGFFELSPVVKRIFEDAEAISAQPLREISMDGSAASLRNCAVLEPLLTAFSLSYIALLRLKDVYPHCVAGYSAGETAALYCSEVISREDALRIAAARGRILQVAADQLPGRMVAIFGIPATAIRHLVEDVARDGIIEVAGHNAPDHLTIVGEQASVRRIEHQASAQGATVYPVDVNGAWHCLLAKEAADAISDYLEDIVFHPPTVALYTSASGNLEYHPERLRQGLSRQIYKPVLWQATITNMAFQHDIRHFIEVGKGRTLQSISRRIATSLNYSEFHFLNPICEQVQEHVH
jgi:[acyl-carrier-protein] S-malonyltransferase